MAASKQITLLGLGPGSLGQLSLEAKELIDSMDTLYVRTAQHPVVEFLKESTKIISFDHLYDQFDGFDEVYKQIVAEIFEFVESQDSVCYAVPGHPFVAEATAPEIARQAREKGIDIRVVSGMSFIEPALAAIGEDLYPQTSMVDALEIAESYHPKFPPSYPALITQIYSSEIANEVKLTLMAQYDDQHPIRMIHAAGSENEVVEDLPLHAMDKSLHIGLLTCIYVPPIEQNTSLEEFQELIAHLRSPEGCPWDREQDHQSLRRNLLEECYELLDAIDQNDTEAMLEEFGDMLVQIVLHAQIANEFGEFRMSDIINGIHTKLVNRHPHVFGDLEISDAQGVVDNWEQLKAEERSKKGKAEKGTLDSIAETLPALAQAEAFGARAARHGFEWKHIDGVIEKINEEVDELKSSADAKNKHDEFGDLLFALVNFARWEQIDPEVALRETNARFRHRFGFIEKHAKSHGMKISEMSLDEMELLWEEAKSSP
jgi:tetrapyrrole methylase family protein/MazG family protein